MTNFIYNIQDELFNLNMILPAGEFSTIKKLVDHIEAQGKQLRELNAAITKRNKTIEKYECEKKDLQERNSCLYKKVVELNNGIHNSEDLTWKQKYEALLHSSEQAIGALQKKCQEYKNAETDATAKTIETLVKENKELEEKNKKIEENFKKLEHRRNELITRGNELSAENKKLEAEKKIADDRWWEAEKELTSMKLANKKLERGTIEHLEKRCREVEKALEDEKQVNKDLNAIINSKNKLLDEYMTKANKLEHNYKEEVIMKEQFKTTCVEQEITIEHLKEEVFDYIRLNAVLRGKLVSIGELANK